MCRVCDNPEGNLCRNCETELAEVKQQSVYNDGWWPIVAVRRSINNALASSAQPEETLYV